MMKLPEGKVYYSITEIADLTKVKPHVLRYWESEFPALSPRKNRAGNRVYQGKDIKLIFLIKHLLYEEGYTIAGAKKKLSKKGILEDQKEEAVIETRKAGLIEALEQDLQRILKILS
ncbi:MAG: MerR family transcriptional regulator [Candidatus Eisenbacteria bacterium]